MHASLRCRVVACSVGREHERVHSSTSRQASDHAVRMSSTGRNAPVTANRANRFAGFSYRRVQARATTTRTDVDERSRARMRVVAFTSCAYRARAFERSGAYGGSAGGCC
eukprot:355719-Pleurochrysis_carterae.AAC.2